MQVITESFKYSLLLIVVVVILKGLEVESALTGGFSGNNYTRAGTFWNLFGFLQTNEQTLKSPNPIVNYPSCPAGFVGPNCDVECGITYFSQNSFDKIVGGKVANYNSWPAQVYLKGCTRGGDCLLCGGTLIDLTTVLTAAHCVDKRQSTYAVYLGLQDTNLLWNNQWPASPIKKIIMHQYFDPKTNLNDIAIIKLAQPAILSMSVQVACLPTTPSYSYPPVNWPAWAIGWGTTFADGATSNLLRNVKLKIDDPSLCWNYGSSDMNWNIQICSHAPGKDTCQGDSGGPLYVADYVGGKSKYVLAGITSYGNGCALAKYPGIYTRVSAFLSWIAVNR